VNAFKRLHGLILDVPGLDSTTAARGARPAGDRDRTMNRPHPRRRRGAAGRTGRTRPAPAGFARLTEGPPVNPPLYESDVRHDLVARVRQEIQAGTYDTPEKLEAALDRLAARLAAD
jgi:negative regulator of flagellin synthesis FlgM